MGRSVTALAVIVPTYRRPGAVCALLGDVLAQWRPGDEIVVVDQSPEVDRAPVAAFCAAQAGISLLHAPPGLPAARNLGIGRSTAPAVLFLDDDARLHPGCLDGHRRVFDDPTVGGAVGRIVERALAPNARRTTNRVDRAGRIRTRLDGWARCDIETLKGANMSLRRQALAEAGPFDPGFGGTALLEDADLSVRVRRAGWRLVFAPDAGVDHLHLPVGGVRTGDPGATARWRLHNTARFVRRHGRRRDLPWVLAVQLAIAARFGVTTRDPSAPWRLARAFVAGWRGAEP